MTCAAVTSGGTLSCSARPIARGACSACRARLIQITPLMSLRPVAEVSRWLRRTPAPRRLTRTEA